MKNPLALRVMRMNYPLAAFRYAQDAAAYINLYPRPNELHVRFGNRVVWPAGKWITPEQCWQRILSSIPD